MNNAHLQRINNQISFVLSDCISNRLNDKTISDSIITVTRVDTSVDYSVCKVAIAVSLDTREERQVVLDAIIKATGFLRKQIAERVKIRQVPKLIFSLDENMLYSMKIENIIKNLNIPHVDEEGDVE